MSRLFFPQRNVLRRKTRKRQATSTSPKTNFSLFHFVAILATKGFLTKHFGFFALEHALLHTTIIPTTGFGIYASIRNTYRQFGIGIFFFHLTNEVMTMFMKWRRGRDSNPRYLAVHPISSRAHSTTLPPLLSDSMQTFHLFVVGKQR